MVKKKSCKGICIYFAPVAFSLSDYRETASLTQTFGPPRALYGWAVGAVCGACCLLLDARRARGVQDHLFAPRGWVLCLFACADAAPRRTALQGLDRSLAAEAHSNRGARDSWMKLTSLPAKFFIQPSAIAKQIFAQDSFTRRHFCSMERRELMRRSLSTTNTLCTQLRPRGLCLWTNNIRE